MLAEAGRLARVRRETAADRGQRLAPEAQRGDAFQIGQRGDLAGGVAGEGQRQLFAGDAAAVVDDLQAAQAAFLDADLDLGGAGVQGVFQQLLDGEAGRSITSPAAIWLIRMSGSTAMGRDAAVSVAAGRENWLAESVMANRWGRRVGRWASIIGSAFARRRHTAIAAAGNPLG